MVLYPETPSEARIRRLERLLRFCVPSMAGLTFLSLLLSVAMVNIVPGALRASILFELTVVAILAPYLLYARRLGAHLQRSRRALEQKAA
jgi:hypothetical protein